MKIEEIKELESLQRYKDIIHFPGCYNPEEMANVSKETLSYHVRYQFLKGRKEEHDMHNTTLALAKHILETAIGSNDPKFIKEMASLISQLQDHLIQPEIHR